MIEHNFLVSALVYLLAAVIAVPLAQRLGLGSVLGYLLAGVIIGPWGIALIHDPEEILHFAEFGVVLLLFLIGLELNLNRLWDLRKPILGMGGVQVVVTTLLLTAIGLLLGVSLNIALIAAMGLALSSTAIALQILGEKRLMPTQAGQSAFSILLFQDIAVIPMLAFIPLLATTEVTNNDSNTLLSVLKVIGVIGLIIIGGRYAIRPVFRYIASSGLREVFIAFSLLLVIGVALLMQAVEMSMALGAFIAGVLLAESEYRHELETDIEPFKGLLMGLFFIAVGMSVDFGLLLAKPLIIIGLVSGLIAVKCLVLWLLAIFGKLPNSQRALFTFLLSQGGEFAFVIFSVATVNTVIPEATAAILVVVVALSMVTTPLLLILNDKLIQPRFVAGRQQTFDMPEEPENPVIIAGFGRVGQMIGRLLQANQFRTTIIDYDPDQIEMLRRFGHKVYYGDAARLDLLHAAGANEARLLVVAVDDEQISLDIIDKVQQHFPQLPIIARARNRTHAYELLDRKVTRFERETFLSAIHLGEKALQQLGFSATAAATAAAKFRQHDEATMHKLHPIHKDTDQLVSSIKQSRADLEQLFATEQEENDAQKTSAT